MSDGLKPFEFGGLFVFIGLVCILCSIAQGPLWEKILFLCGAVGFIILGVWFYWFLTKWDKEHGVKSG